MRAKVPEEVCGPPFKWAPQGRQSLVQLAATTQPRAAAAAGAKKVPETAMTPEPAAAKKAPETATNTEPAAIPEENAESEVESDEVSLAGSGDADHQRALASVESEGRWPLLSM